MGRKKHKLPTEQFICWYCDREFADEDTLIQHQKARHFKCPWCNKRLHTAPGMVIHCNSVHKEELKEVPNSLPGREDSSLEIIGMAGLPPGVVEAFAAGKRGAEISALAAKKAKTDAAAEAPTSAAAATPALVAGMPPMVPSPFLRPPVPGMMPPPFGVPGMVPGLGMPPRFPMMGMPRPGFLGGGPPPYGGFPPPYGYSPRGVQPPGYPQQQPGMGPPAPPPQQSGPPATPTEQTLQGPPQPPSQSTGVTAPDASSGGGSALFPAYGGENPEAAAAPVVEAAASEGSSVATATQKMTSMPSVGNARLVHPTDPEGTYEMSVEERRASLSKYRRGAQPTAAAVKY